MGEFRNRMYQNYRSEFGSDEKFDIAYKKVKRLKGFYSHLRVYIIVNFIIIVASVNSDFFTRSIYETSLFDWRTYSTAFYWGIGLLFHAFSVFGRDWFFTQDWEQKKIQEYMSKEQAKADKWE
ncbi:2TM domain-containing protein [Flavobacterium procerum]|uniref:2TM domain-containing protein n=1 Tax=Flavobacterium procerum TaxID=1455569 RepID=A0ABV6BZK4_9FLAO